jgi:hypothetical protein
LAVSDLRDRVPAVSGFVSDYSFSKNFIKKPFAGEKVVRTGCKMVYNRTGLSIAAAVSPAHAPDGVLSLFSKSEVSDDEKENDSLSALATKDCIASPAA